MDNMLSEALREYHGLREQLDRALLGGEAEKWHRALKTFMRGEPTWAEGMINIPLQWTPDLGEIHRNIIPGHISSFNQRLGLGWRLPTDKELSRSLRAMRPEGFHFGKCYWTSSPSPDGDRDSLLVIENESDGRRLNSMSSRYFERIGMGERSPHLRLCREINFSDQVF